MMIFAPKACEPIPWLESVATHGRTHHIPNMLYIQNDSEYYFSPLHGK